jgi:hypothetical protein
MHFSSNNLCIATATSSILGRIKRVEYGFFPAEIPAIKPAAHKHHPVPATAGLANLEFETGHFDSFGLEPARVVAPVDKRTLGTTQSGAGLEASGERGSLPAVPCRLSRYGDQILSFHLNQAQKLSEPHQNFSVQP